MELMNITDALELIRLIRTFNDDDIEYVKIHACSGKPVYFTNFEEVVSHAITNVRKDEWDKTCILIDGYPLLKVWDRLDADTINVHAPLNVIEVKIEEE